MDTNKNKRLPTFGKFILEQDEAPAPEPTDEPTEDEILNQKLAELTDTRNDLLDQQQEARSSNDLITSETLDIDIQIIDLQMQMARLEADKIRVSKKGI